MSINIEVGKEYEYIGDWVTVVEIHGDPKDARSEVLIETRFGHRTRCELGELSEKPPRKKKP